MGPARGTRHAPTHRAAAAEHARAGSDSVTAGARSVAAHTPLGAAATLRASCGSVPAAALVAGGLLSLVLAALLVVAGLSWFVLVPDRASSPSMLTTAGPQLGDGFAVWEVNDDGYPVRWDPCRPIEVVLSPQGAPPVAAADLEEALERLANATGLELVLTGVTDERPAAARLPYQPERYGERWAPILVAWAAPGEAGLPLRTTDRGLAIPIAAGPEGDRTYLTAQVVLNAERMDLRPGFGDRSDSWGATLLHELGHALGLDHVEDPEQLMSVFPGHGPVELGDGDRAGLSAVGATHGCRPVPTPGPLTVAPPTPPRPAVP